MLILQQIQSLVPTMTRDLLMSDALRNSEPMKMFRVGPLLRKQRPGLIRLVSVNFYSLDQTVSASPARSAYLLLILELDPKYSEETSTACSVHDPVKGPKQKL